jgi:hypothetical protein
VLDAANSCVMRCRAVLMRVFVALGKGAFDHVVVDPTNGLKS